MRMVISFATALLIAAPALAGQDNQLPPRPIASTVPKGKAVDPNKMICEKVVDTGTRLGGRRICHTAAEWTEIRQLSRRELDKIQANRYNGNQ